MTPHVTFGALVTRRVSLVAIYIYLVNFIPIEQLYISFKYRVLKYHSTSFFTIPNAWIFVQFNFTFYMLVLKKNSQTPPL